MIDPPPVLPPASEQVIEQRLVECGLKKSGFNVAYQAYLQSIEIVISPQAGATSANFECVRRAVGYEIVRFEDAAMQMAYSDFENELARPSLLADAKQRLEQRGLLVGFPKREAFSSLESYARAIEAYCGFEAGSTLKVVGDSLVFDPPRTDAKPADFAEKYSILFLAMQYAVASGDFKSFGFIGNEKSQEPEGQ